MIEAAISRNDYEQNNQSLFTPHVNECNVLSLTMATSYTLSNLQAARHLLYSSNCNDKCLTPRNWNSSLVRTGNQVVLAWLHAYRNLSQAALQRSQLRDQFHESPRQQMWPPFASPLQPKKAIKSKSENSKQARSWKQIVQTQRGE